MLSRSRRRHLRGLDSLTRWACSFHGGREALQSPQRGDGGSAARQINKRPEEGRPRGRNAGRQGARLDKVKEQVHNGNDQIGDSESCVVQLLGCFSHGRSVGDISPEIPMNFGTSLGP